MKTEEIELLRELGNYLNTNPASITSNMVNKVKKSGASDKYAFRALLLEYLNYNPLLEKYYDDIINEDDISNYLSNDYYKDINIQNKKFASWEIKRIKYAPYELFVMDDFQIVDNLVLPKIGFFSKPFSYLAVFENNRMWMSITPNEINTMKKPIDLASGNVLTFGLGLGYFSYMVSNKDNVSSVTIIEKDKRVIELFKNIILPHFKNKEKIKIIEDDAYSYLSSINDNTYDYIFIDIYHDVSDGLLVYNKMKPDVERLKNTKVDFWIYETIKYYLK